MAVRFLAHASRPHVLGSEPWALLASRAFAHARAFFLLFNHTARRVCVGGPFVGFPGCNTKNGAAVFCGGAPNVARREFVSQHYQASQQYNGFGLHPLVVSQGSDSVTVLPEH